jgi:hypothetical protein
MKLSPRRIVAAVATAAAVLIGGGVAYAVTVPPADLHAAGKSTSTFTVRGSVVQQCGTCRGYDDIDTGAQVEVVNGKNEVLAIGKLGSSKLDAGVKSDGTSYATFTYEFTVAGVPRGEKLYGVHVGNANRGIIWESEMQASTTGFALSIGN